MQVLCEISIFVKTAVVVPSCTLIAVLFRFKLYIGIDINGF